MKESTEHNNSEFRCDIRKNKILEKQTKDKTGAAETSQREKLNELDGFPTDAKTESKSSLPTKEASPQEEKGVEAGAEPNSSWPTDYQKNKVRRPYLENFNDKKTPPLSGKDHAK